MNQTTTNVLKVNDQSFNLRSAQPKDASLVVQFMKKLGKYQKMSDKIIVTPERMQFLLETGKGEAIIGEYKGEPVTFAYFYEKSSAFTGRTGLYIDGLLVDESMRGEGIGNKMMKYISQLALDRGCELLEWGCLDWNEPAIEFYKQFGAFCVDNMRIYRLTPSDLIRTANKEFY